jgi:Zn-dependent protease with chaperone function
MPWVPSYSDVLQFYFGTNYVIYGVAIAASALVASLILFRASKERNSKTRALISSLTISASLWIFIISSLALCAIFMRDYATSPGRMVFEASILALIPSLTLGPVAFYVLRSRALKEIYPFFVLGTGQTNHDALDNRITSTFSDAVAESKLGGVRLSVVSGESWLPASAALEWRGERAVAISKKDAELLDDEELKAVLAHELGHIAHKDSLQKTIATAFRTAFPFDPLVRFVEAAIYRNGELAADEYSAKLTKKPASLASALLKIYQGVKPAGKSASPSNAWVFSSLMRAQGDSGLFSKQPSLSFRIKRLLEIDAEISGSAS